jgi:hypothetical protein
MNLQKVVVGKKRNKKLGANVPNLMHSKKMSVQELQDEH